MHDLTRDRQFPPPLIRLPPRQETLTCRPSSSGTFPHRNSSSSRQHSHSVSLGALNPTHRITRRKSINSATAATTAHAVAAVLRDQGEASVRHTTSHRKSLGSRKGQESTSMGDPSSIGTYFSETALASGTVHHDGQRKAATGPTDENVVEEDHGPEKSVTSKGRNRRASEGSHLAKADGKSLPLELRCDTCGKGYKHSSCLTKHL